jgi:hypothetical protein
MAICGNLRKKLKAQVPRPRGSPGLSRPVLQGATGAAFTLRISHFIKFVKRSLKSAIPAPQTGRDRKTLKRRCQHGQGKYITE